MQRSKARRRLLPTVEEAFNDHEYNPLIELIKLGKKKRLTKTDRLKFSIHRELCLKHYPNVAAVTLRGDPENPLIVHTLEAKLNEGLQRRNEARNGHARTVTNAH